MTDTPRSSISDESGSDIQSQAPPPPPLRTLKTENMSMYQRINIMDERLSKVEVELEHFYPDENLDPTFLEAESVKLQIVSLRMQCRDLKITMDTLNKNQQEILKYVRKSYCTIILEYLFPFLKY